ncbi:MAG: hypothetical protein ABSH44_10070 [Bryobacteraceae bacterium]|jgi:hypothetical protein
MRTRWWLTLIWGCFLARLAFYSAMLPLWEGFDEWGHFAVIRAMAVRGELLAASGCPIPRDVEAALQLAPLPWDMRHYPPPYATEDEYWGLAAESRQLREARFQAIPAHWSQEASAGGLTTYEAFQPPLYHWMMTPVLRLMSGRSLAAQVMALRWLGSLIASLAIPLIFWIGRETFRDDARALGCAAVAAVMPELAIDFARVGNECVAVVLFTLLTWIALKRMRAGPRYSPAAWLGLVLGFGLLAKAYFLTAALAMALLLGYEFWQARGRRLAAIWCALIVASESILIAGWWYAHNLLTTGTLSGLSESLMLRGMSQASLLGRAATVPWGTAIDAILFSHLYCGGWSALTVRSWMYHVFYAVILLAAAGLFRLLRQPAIRVLAMVFAAFWIGLLYDVLLIYVTKGIATTGGWYLYAVVGAEVALCLAGLCAILPIRVHRWVVFGGVLLFALLDLYTVHAVAIPYYTGMIRHKANGALAALHLADLRRVGVADALQRLVVYKAAVISEPVLMALWLAYLAGTLAIVICAARFFTIGSAPQGKGNTKAECPCRPSPSA